MESLKLSCENVIIKLTNIKKPASQYTVMRAFDGTLISLI